MKLIKVTRVQRRLLTCSRCEYQWMSDKIEVKRCAKCRSPYFDRPRVELPKLMKRRGRA